MGKQSSHEESELDLYVNALSFRMTVHFLNTGINSQDRVLRNLLYWPMVVNEAFALELYLKCLHFVRNRTVPGHDLKAFLKN